MMPLVPIAARTRSPFIEERSTRVDTAHRGSVCTDGDDGDDGDDGGIRAQLEASAYMRCVPNVPSILLCFR
jgi:hypothetical protein